MATYTWSVPTGQTITGSTYIKDTDNKLQTTVNDLVDFVNGEGVHAGQGLTYDFMDKASAQTATGVKTFSNGIVSNVTGNVTGDVTGNAGTATKLATSRTISLSGDVTGSVAFDGSANAAITATVADDSHNHIIGNVDGLQTALDGKLGSTANAVSASKLATARSITLSGDVSGTVNFDGTANVGITTTVTDDSHTHDGRYYTEAEVNALLAGKQAAGTYNTIIGTDSDINTSGATIIDNLYMTDGVITSHGTRNLTAADLGLTNLVRTELYYYKYYSGSSGYNINTGGYSVSVVGHTSTYFDCHVTFPSSNRLEQAVVKINLGAGVTTGAYINHEHTEAKDGNVLRCYVSGANLHTQAMIVIVQAYF